jgi:undecaprenyl diphosphate synthase
VTVYEKVISNLNGNLDDDSKKQDIAQALLSPETTEEEITHLFSIFWVARFIDLELLKGCIEYYAKKQNIIHLFDSIGERAQSLHNDMPHELEEYAFELVISPNGYERFMGRHLWDEFEMDNSDIDILSMNEEFQRKAQDYQSQEATMADAVKQIRQQELQEMHEDNVRIHFIGDIDGLPDYLQEEIRKAEELMKNNTGVKFNVATNYGGQDEMIRAIQKIAVSVQNGEITPADIQKELIEDSLDTCGNPPVDLLIRTGGDHRLSDFLLWQVAYAEFYSAEVPWPEFSPKCFVKAIKEFNNRDRRFGGLNDDKK